MKAFCINNILYVILLCNLILTAQNKKITDSLVKVITNKKTLDTTMVKALNDLGIQYATSDPKQAKKYIKKALKISHKINRPRGIAGSNNCLGVVYYYQKEYDSALVHYERALKINTEIGHSWGQASALHQMGTIYNCLNQYHTAIKSFKNAGEIFKSLKDSVSYIKSIENIGVSFSFMKYNEKALRCFIKANELYEELYNQSGIARTYINISNILIKQEEYKKALKYLHKALPPIQETGNKRYLSVILKNIGISHRGLGDYPQALHHLQKSLSLIKGNIKASASVQSYIGSTYYEMKQYDKGLHYLKRALKNYSPKGNFMQKAITQNSIAKSFLEINQLDSATFYAEKSLHASKTAVDLHSEKEANHTLARIAEQSNNTVAAYQYYKNLAILKDSLKHTEKHAQVRELQTKFETNQKQQKINELEKQNKLAKSKNYLLALGFGIGLLISGSFIFVIKKKFKLSCLEKTLLSKELDAKKKELTTNSLHLAKKNSVLENLKEEVEMIKYSEDQNAQYNYQKVVQIINFDLMDDHNWENFKKHFEEIHKNFYSTIKSKYPTVTANELRLMALLKMNLSSKEIANILNITQEGVRKARYRLRKKLKITTNTILLDFILTI
ncbi:tetratricopeptide repeat protein [Aquimarina sp. M1]